MVVKFITLKWGIKYGPEYVNRLYRSIEKTYSGKFEFYCYTDDPSNLICNTIPIEKLRDNLNFKNVFTIEKLALFKNLPFEGPYIFLDLDILVLKDLKHYFDSYNFVEPRIGYVYWSPPDRIYSSFHRGDCYVNSSFLTWNKDQFKYVYDTYMENKKIIDHKFRSFDKFLFYFCKLKYHPKEIMYSYNFGAEYPNELEPGKFLDNYYISIFNTSNKEGKELHECSGWAQQYWESL